MDSQQGELRIIFVACDQNHSRLFERSGVEVKENGMVQLKDKGSLIVGALAAAGASVCCVGPLVLLALGIGGTGSAA